MPIKVQSDLPAKKILEEENIFMMDETRAMHQDIRPLQIAILNLMPFSFSSFLLEKCKTEPVITKTLPANFSPTPSSAVKCTSFKRSSTIRPFGACGSFPS